MKKKMNTITTINGKVVKIQEDGRYTAIYRNEKGRIIIKQNLNLEYPCMPNIGHDNCEGNGPEDARIYFDGRWPEWTEKKEILYIGTDEEFEKMITIVIAMNNNVTK